MRRELTRNKLIFYLKTILFFVALIILILGSISVITYKKTLDMLCQDAIQSGMHSLNRDMNLLDSYLKEVERLTTMLSMNQNVTTVSNIKQLNGSPDFYKFMELDSALPAYNISNTLIKSINIFFPNSNSVVSTQWTSTRLEMFYSDFFRYEDMDYQQWYDYFLLKRHNKEYMPAKDISINYNRERVITYLQSLPFAPSAGNKAVVTVLLDEKELHRLLNSTGISEGCLFYIIYDGEVITTNDSTPSYLRFKPADGMQNKYTQNIIIHGQEYMMIQTSSEYNGWDYVLYLPTKHLFEKVDYIRTLYITSFLLAGCFGILAAVFAICYYSRPVARLAENLVKAKKNVGRMSLQNPIALINSGISNLMSDNDELKLELKRQEPILLFGLYERLLRGQCGTEEISMLRRYWDLDSQEMLFAVLLLRVNSVEVRDDDPMRAELINAQISLIVRKYFNINFHLHNITENRKALMICMPAAEESEIEDILNESMSNVIEELQNKYGINISIGVSQQYSSPLQFGQAYQEAVHAMEYRNYGSVERVVWYNKLIHKVEGYWYPLEVEMQLSHSVISGDKVSVKNLLDMLFSQNLTSMNLSEKEVDLWVCELKGTLLKLKQMCLIETEDNNTFELLMSNIKPVENHEELVRSLIEAFHFLCSKREERKKSHNKKLIQDILHYIEENYSSDMLCLSTVADKFAITENYLSAFFKEQTGENFSSYLERLRLKRAVELMRDNKLSLVDIALQVGYNNTTTFYRAFKRVFGQSPSNFRTSLL